MPPLTAQQQDWSNRFAFKAESMNMKVTPLTIHSYYQEAQFKKNKDVLLRLYLNSSYYGHQNGKISLWSATAFSGRSDSRLIELVDFEVMNPQMLIDYHAQISKSRAVIRTARQVVRDSQAAERAILADLFAKL